MEKYPDYEKKIH